MAVTFEDYNTDFLVKHMSYRKCVIGLDAKIHDLALVLQEG